MAAIATGTICGANFEECLFVFLLDLHLLLHLIHACVLQGVPHEGEELAVGLEGLDLIAAANELL